MPCGLRELIVKVLSILETVSLRELADIIGASINDIMNYVSELITMEGNTVKLNEAGLKEALSIDCEVEAYGKLYEYYRLGRVVLRGMLPLPSTAINTPST